MAASWPGGWLGRRGEGREAARCSCAEDRDGGRGRPCALRQAPAVLRVRAGCASAPVRLQRVGLSSCDAGTGLHSAHSTVRCSSWYCACLLSSGAGPAAEGEGWQAACLLVGRGLGAHHTGGEPM